MISRLIGCLFAAIVVLTGCQNLFNPPDDPVDHRGGNDSIITAAPSFNPPGDTYSTDIEVELSSATAGATIYYTIGPIGDPPDDPEPAAPGTEEYVAPIEIAGDGTAVTIKAIAVASGHTPSAVVSANYEIDYSTAAPSFNPPGDTYSTDIEVELSSATAGATIYYTIGPIGDPPAVPEPNESGTEEYVAPIEIAGDGTAVTIKAIAVADGLAPSAVVSADYVIDYPVAAAPTFDPPAGTYPDDIEVQLSSTTAGATIYYTIGDSPDDPQPGQSGTEEYVAPIEIEGDGTALTIKAIAVAGGHTPSDVVSADYEIAYSVITDAPSFNPPGDTYSTDIEVELSSATAGATIYYTIGPIGDPPDDPEPNESGTLEYIAPIAIEGDGTEVAIKAIAIASGHTPSAVVSADYVIDYPVAAAPSFNPPGDTYSTDIEVELSSTTAGATIYYTIGSIGDPPDDPEPNESGTEEYVAPIEIEGDGTAVTIKAIAVAIDHTPSDVVSADYEIAYSVITDAPSFNPPGDTYSTDIEVELSSTTAGATIYYTMGSIGDPPDDPEPNESGTEEYTGPIEIAGDGTAVTIKAIAVASGHTPSAVVSADYAIEYPEPIPEP